MLPCVAVINADESRTAVWHVDIGLSVQNMSRLAGAWVTETDQIVSQVLRGRLLYSFGDIAPNPEVSAVIGGQIDMPKTLANIFDWIDKWDAIQSESLTPKGQKRAPVPWPELPKPLDWKALPEPQRGVVKDKLIADTIVTSMWIAQLAEKWAAIETLRLGRQHLRMLDPEEHNLPVAVKAL
jgi:hypothetical protein